MMQVKAPCDLLGNSDRPDSAFQAITFPPGALKSLKSGQFQSPGRRAYSLDSVPPPCLSPFAAKSAQRHSLGDLRPTDRNALEDSGSSKIALRQLSAKPKFQGTRQPSLQEWYSDVSVGGTHQTSTLPGNQIQLADTLRFIPHGSPKLTRPNAPVFAPPAPRKGKRQRKPQKPPSSAAVASRDVLSDLLCCDEDLGWSSETINGDLAGTTSVSAISQRCSAASNSAARSRTSSCLDSRSMKLAT